VVALFVLVHAGCFFSDEDGDPANYVAYDQIDIAYKDATCTYLARCGYFPDKATCISAELQPNGSPFFVLSDQALASIGAARVRYNGSNVKTCFDAIAAKSCDTTDDNGRVVVPQCQQVISGAVDAGGECWADIECKSTSCQGNGDSPCRVGTCVGEPVLPASPAQLGQSCYLGLGCAQGLYCDQFSSTCAMLKTAGTLCSSTNECEYGLGCAGTGTAGPTCRELPTIGQPCPDGLCRDDGAYCSSGTTRICMQVGVVGATCTSYEQCSQYYECDFMTSKCAEPPRIGESCSSGSMCFDADAYCDPTTTTCMAGRADGSPCTSNLECASGACTGSMCGEIPYSCP
jgi:hypothetical protein